MKSRQIISAVLLAAFCRTGSVAQQAIDQYQVKAAYLLNFAQFVKWPADGWGKSADPFAICILGRNPFGSVLETMVEGKSIDGHSFMVRQLTEARQGGGCQILFVSASERLRYRAVLNDLKGSAVFSVGDTSDFVKEGGVACLWVENGRVQIDLNGERAKEHNLKVSSRLLGLSRTAR